VGIVGARGYAGAELIGLVAGHPGLELAFASSRRLSGEPIAEHVNAWTDEGEFVSLDPEGVARSDADVVVLALPDGACDAYAEALDRHRGDGVLVVDLSSDRRFDARSERGRWVYGLAERHPERLAAATRIANPGCYATAVQLALWPILGLIEGVPHAFGVSGFSGAGTTPSDRNDESLVRDGVWGYRLVGHNHEREVSERLGRRVRFMPHVAGFFRGLSVTCSFEIGAQVTAARLLEAYRDAYASGDRDGRSVVRVTEEVPRIQTVAGTCGAVVGGVHVGEPEQGGVRRGACVCVLDNLRKGAASQAVQCINLALGRSPTEGLEL